MNTLAQPATLAQSERRLIQVLFVIAAVWNFDG